MPPFDSVCSGGLCVRHIVQLNNFPNAGAGVCKKSAVVENIRHE